MNKALWTLQILLAVAFAGAGSTKLLTPKSELAANMGWVDDFSEVQIKLVGAAEVVGAIGLIAPMAVGVVPILTPVAGVGLAALMAGAVATHVGRGEPPYAPLVLAVLAAAVVAGRRGARSGG
jgi:uncharacterized membrane protein YphA (DoxX/SURF4 family)